MTFVPRRALLVPQRAATTEAWMLIGGLFPEAPFEGALDALPLEGPMPAPIGKEGQSPLTGGPIVPRSTCPATGRALRLQIMRDMSALVVRESPRGGEEALPAVLTLQSEVLSHRIADTPFTARGDLPVLRFQGRPDGVRWQMERGEIDEARVRSLLDAALSDAAIAITDGEPVCDPRLNDEPLEGARFAPFSRWPEAREDDPRVAELGRIIRAICLLRVKSFPREVAQWIRIERRPPAEPWRGVKAWHGVRVMHSGTHGYGNNDAHLERFIRKLLAHPLHAMPTSLRHGPEGSTLIDIRTEGAGSSHARIEAMGAIRRLAPDLGVDKLLATRPR